MARGRNRNEKLHTQKNTSSELLVENEVFEAVEEIAIGMEIEDVNAKLFKTAVFQLDIFTPYVLDSSFSYKFVKIYNEMEGDFYISFQDSSDYFSGDLVPPNSSVMFSEKTHFIFYSGSRPSIKIEWYR